MDGWMDGGWADGRMDGYGIERKGPDKGRRMDGTKEMGAGKKWSEQYMICVCACVYI